MSGLERIPGLEQITLVGVNPEGMVNLLHLLLSFLVKLYSNRRSLFAFHGNLPAKGLPLVMEIPHDYFAERHYVHAMPRVDHMTHLGVISPPDWHTT